MSLALTQAEHRVLALIAMHGKAVRSIADHTWSWRINGIAKSGVVGTLFNKGYLTMSPDKSTMVLSAKGRGAIHYLREAA